MGIELAMARVQELHQAVAMLNGTAPPAVARTGAPAPGAPGTAGGGSFAGALNQAMGAAPTGAVAAPGGAGGVGGRLVKIAAGEVGQAEQPPGSNNSTRIAQYRTATAGSGVGPWCAYFLSWVSREAGVPLGDRGQGFGRVDDVYAWAQRTGRAIPASSGQPPRPGDLIVWDEHIGIVESVGPEGIRTIEGNSSDQVARRVHRPGDAIGYVRLG